MLVSDDGNFVDDECLASFERLKEVNARWDVYYSDSGYESNADLEKQTATQVILFYLFVLPVAGVLLVLLWRVYLHACDNCERTLSRKQSVVYNLDMQDFRLRHECCKKNVAPILFSLPPDFNFKHTCGSKCKGPKVWQPD